MTFSSPRFTIPGYINCTGGMLTHQIELAEIPSFLLIKFQALIAKKMTATPTIGLFNPNNLGRIQPTKIEMSIFS